VAVRAVPGGIFSSWLLDGLRVGDPVEVLPPTGFFTPDLATPGHHVLVAAGSGITPMMSIAGSVLAADDRSRVTLFYGNRRAQTVMFADELADLKDRYPARFQLVHVLSREPQEAQLLSGRIEAARLAALIEAFVDVSTVDHWWLCGPLGMVDDARKVLTGLGVPDERVHRELFYAEDEPVVTLRHADAVAAGPASRVTLTLDGRTSEVPVPAGGTILDAGQKLRPDLPFACRGGVCGTCRALVVQGEVRMRRNFALERAEVDAGYVLTCQSEPLTDTVAVDYDA
jgi:ring-1,2-phenylacetyl-CoA epoxidase subunit PaaE